MTQSIALFYGHVARNVGDIAINTGQIRMLREAHPDASIHVVLLNVKKSSYTESSKASFGPDCRVNFVEIADSWLNPLDYAQDPSRFLEDCGVAHADLIVLAAGEHLFSYADNENVHNLFWRALPALAARQAGKRCVVMPSTFGPYQLPDSRALVEHMLAEPTRFAARDVHSAEILADIVPAGNVEALLDPAFFLEAPDCPVTVSDGPCIGLAMRSENWGLRLAPEKRRSIKTDDPALWEDDLAFQFSLAFCRKVLSEDSASIAMFVQTDADRAIVETVTAALVKDGIAGEFKPVTVKTVDSYLAALSSVDRVVASRFHALILGMVCGKPGFGVHFGVHGHKIPGLMKLLEHPGQCLDLAATDLDEAVETVFDRTVRSPVEYDAFRPRIEELRSRTRAWLAAPWSPSVRENPLGADGELTVHRFAGKTAMDKVQSLRKQNAVLSNDLKRLKSDLVRARKRITQGEQHARQAEAKVDELIAARERAIDERDHAQAKSKTFSRQAYRLKRELDKAQRDTYARRHQNEEQSTSFRLGEALVRAARSPRELLKLPREVGRVVRKRRDAALMGASASRADPAESVELANIARAKGTLALIAHLQEKYPLDRERQAKGLVDASKAFSDRNPETELDLVRHARAIEKSEFTLRALFWAAHRNGALLEAWEATRALEKLYGPNPGRNRQAVLDKMRRSPAGQLALLAAIPTVSHRTVNSVPGRLCYVLHNSLPYSSGGYATRARGMVRGLAASGIETVIVTRPGFPLDSKPDLSASEVPLEETIEGIPYRRLLEPTRKGSASVDYMDAAADALTDLLAEVRPSFVMAASNHLTGLPALIAARRLGLPFFYEVRGFWEITRISREPEFETTPAYRIQELLEAETARHADHVFTITWAMKEEMVRRGVPAEHITLLPNSCDPSRFVPRERDGDLAARLGIVPDVPVIGYVGTFAQYEGLELLVEAAAELKERGRVFRLLLVGNENVSGQEEGPITGEIRRIAADRQLEDWLIMPGRVPHEQAEAYYSLIDIAPFPRKSRPVSEMVSPMKPLEAFAMEKAVVVSSVAALREMVDGKETGLVFDKDDVGSLANTLDRLIADPDLRARLGRQARKWVERERTWEKTMRIAAERFRLVPPRPAQKSLSRKERAPRQKARSRIRLLRHVRGWQAVELSPSIANKSVLYLLHNCLPYHTGGYSVRAHGLLQGFQHAGWNVIAQARPGYPADRMANCEIVQRHIADGVEYRFLSDTISIDQEDQVAYIEQYAESVLNSINAEQVGYVQAASFFQNGLAGRIIADRLGVPLVYEMRGLEWFTNGSSDPQWQHTMHGIIGREVELAAARCADHVFAITGALKSWLIAHGLPEENVSVLSNGCTGSELGKIPARDGELAHELDLAEGFVVGYIGSVVFYEGIETIIDAIALLREQRGLDVRFLLVGDGPHMARLQKYVGESGTAHFVRLVGRVPHHEVDRYYGLIDAFAMARTDSEICQVISPLKPLETMMKGKLLITSDVAAIGEMVDASRGGAMTFPAGDAEQLADRIEQAMSDPENSARIAAKGRRWAVNKRNWDALAREALETLEDRFGSEAKHRQLKAS